VVQLQVLVGVLLRWLLVLVLAAVRIPTNN
jgi:hypothetical protein